MSAFSFTIEGFSVTVQAHGAIWFVAIIFLILLGMLIGTETLKRDARKAVGAARDDARRYYDTAIRIKNGEQVSPKELIPPVRLDWFGEK